MHFEVFCDVLRNSILITGLVIIMMLTIEYINVASQGKWFSKIKKSRVGQVVLGALLGVFPGCIGGFATVSLYSHGMLSFGALVAMMIASSGDEAFVMLAMIPGDAIILFVILLFTGIIVGLVIDLFPSKRKTAIVCNEDDYALHREDIHNHDKNTSCTGDCPKHSFSNLKNPGWERILLLTGIAAFIIALAFGMLEHEHAEHGHEHSHGFNILDEYWLNVIFALLSIFVLWFTAVSEKHFIKEHLWRHVIKKHFLQILGWTFGALLVIQVGLHFFDIESWTKANVPFMILLAVLIGMIPESGPHLIFVTLFAQGMVPFSVLIASSISQDGHASLPLLADNKKIFLNSKIITALIGIITGFIFYAFGM